MNWQERINEELIRARFEEQRQSYEVDEANKAAHDRFEQKMQRVSGVLDRLQVGQTLEEIKNNVWRGGTLEHFEYMRPARIISLRYEYTKPQIAYEAILKKRLGFYTELETVGWDSGGDGGGHGGFAIKEERRKFGWHEEQVGDIAFLRWERSPLQEIPVLSIEIHEVVDYRRHISSAFVLSFRGTRREEKVLNPDNLNDEEIRSWLDKLLLKDCVTRTAARSLPWQIEEDMPKRLEEVQRRIQTHNDGA